jgi:hypothetical protein
MKMKWKYTNTHAVEKIIRSLKTKDSSGYDEITSRIIKLSLPFIISPLTHICNAALCYGVFPDRLKCAIVKPCFKKGTRQEITNYRPISLLTAFSKIFEKLMYIRLITHIESNNVLVNEQYGFRAHSSTEKAAFTLINKILTALNSRMIVGGIFCDLQKAFDCVNHTILMNKLEFYGITGKFKTLINSYLTGRQQRVILSNKSSNDNSSNWDKIKCGVLQGSILGPLFFLLYINDLPKIISRDNNMVLFADDTSIIITDSNKWNFKINLNQTFNKINTWFNANLLTLNFKKNSIFGVSIQEWLQKSNGD